MLQDALIPKVWSTKDRHQYHVKGVGEWGETKSNYDDETTQLLNPSIDHLSKALSDL